MSEREEEAKSRSFDRLERQRKQLAPFRLVVVVAVVVPTLNSHPSAGFSGRGLGVTVALVVFAFTFLLWPSRSRRQMRDVTRLAQLAVVGAAAVSLAFLQPLGASEIPASAAVFVAGVGLSTWWAFGYGLAVTGTLAVALALPLGASAETVVSSALLCGVLGVTGALLRRSRVSQDQTELLLVQLEEARDEQARAAARDERANIAREMHDVLAHSLSGLSLQLEGARRLALVDDVSPDLRAAIDRAASLAKQGLVEARDAVGALRHDQSMSIDELATLVAHYRDDVGLVIDYSTTGLARPVGGDVALVLYRVLGEALTNVARHAPLASTRVELGWEVFSLRLVVVDDGPRSSTPTPSPGGGWGLIGMRERVQRLGGVLDVGPTSTGWSLEARVPA